MLNYFPAIYPGELLIEQGGISALHFFRCHGFYMPAKQPFVTERIANGSRAFSVKLILQRPNDCGARTYRSCEGGIYICDVQVN